MTWIIDSHIHLDDPAYDQDREEIIARLSQEGVLALVNPGCDLESSRKAFELAKENPQIFACVGTHPESADLYDDELEGQYREWAKADKVVAIGEIGLDYHYDDNPPREIQKETLEKQLILAKELDLPAVIHCRDAAEDTYETVKNYAGELSILMHCFNEDEETFHKFSELGCYFSIGGMLTFKNAPHPRELAKNVDLSRLLIETDGPYLSPVPFRGKRNLPSYALYSLKKVAEIRGLPLEEMAKIVIENTGRFYDIEDQLNQLEALF